MPTFIVNGKAVTIDEVDIPLLEAHSWWWNNMGYLITKVYLGRCKRKTIGLHRLILGDPPSEAIDHINHDPSDNRRCNLRQCTNAENNQNRRLTTKYGKGVTPRSGRWQVVIKIKGKAKWFGVYKTREEALQVADAVFASLAA